MPHVPFPQSIVPTPPPSSTVTPCSPSPALLALLASITPVVPPRAPAPDFLCPSLASTTANTNKRRRSQQPALQRLRDRDDHDRIPLASSSTTTSLPVPVKYEQSDDGKWYPAKSWSLHGKSKVRYTQSCPLSALTTTTPLAALTHFHPSSRLYRVRSYHVGIIQYAHSHTPHLPWLTNPHTASSSTPQSTNDITDSLPTGWKPGPERTKFYDTPVIIVVSLILAIVVTLVIAGCVLSHKNRSAARDLERAKRVRAQGGPEDSEDDDDDHNRDEDDADVRNMPRRQRRRQQQSSLQSSASTTLVPTPSSPSSSRVPPAKKDKMWERWRRQAKAGLRRRRRWRRPVEDNAEPLQRESMAPPPPQTLPSPTPLPPSPPSPPPPALPLTPTLPPAYRRISRARQEDNNRNGPEERTQDEEAGEGRTSVPLRAHVATDDKAVLERMRREASEPWQGEGICETEDGDVAVSAGVGGVVRVPVWEDERLEDFGEMADADHEDGAGPSSTRVYAYGHGAAHADTHLHLPLPPHPIRAYIHDHHQHNPRRRREDEMHVHEEEDEDDLSFGLLPYYVPRFEAGPSAPPVLVVDAGPSAPPLSVEDQTDEEVMMVGSQPDDEGEGSGVGVGVGDPSAPPGEDEDPDVHPSAPPLDESPERDWSRLGHVPWTSSSLPPPPPPLSFSSSSSRTDSDLPTHVGGSGLSSRSSVCVDSHAGLPRYEP